MGRFQNNPSIGWVHPKSTHACPLAWDNKKPKKKSLTCKEKSTCNVGRPSVE
jgi:hypothetical protein